MWLVNFVQGKNCLLEKTCQVTVGGRNLPGGSSETTPTCVNPYFQENSVRWQNSVGAGWRFFFDRSKPQSGVAGAE
jgi:hypothetical protein